MNCYGVCMRYERSPRAKAVRKQYETHELSWLQPREDGKSNTVSTVLKDNPIAEPVYEPMALTGGGKTFAVTTRIAGAIVTNTIEKHHHTMIAEPVLDCQKQKTAKQELCKQDIIKKDTEEPL